MTRPAQEHGASPRWAVLRRHMPDPALWGICGISRDGLITFANEAAAAMLGCGKDSLVGQPVALVRSGPHGMAGAADAADAAWAVYGALSDGLIRRTDNDTFCRGDGTRFAVEYTVTPQVDDGVVKGAVIVFADLSGREPA